MIPIISHPVVKAITQLPEECRNQCQVDLLNLAHHRSPNVSEISNLLQDEDTFRGLSDVKDFMRIDINIDDWIRKIKRV